MTHSFACRIARRKSSCGWQVWRTADLVSQGERKVILDLTELAYIDSAGLGVILSSASRLKQAGGALRLAKVGGRVMQVIKMTHTDSVLPVDVDVITAAGKFEI